MSIRDRTETPNGFGVVIAVANRDFDVAILALETKAQPHLYTDELALLAAILRVVRGAVSRLRPRIPTVGDALTSTGVPPLHGWSSCLSLGDLEAAFRKAVA